MPTVMADVPLVPAAEPRRVLSQDLRPGMVIRYRDQLIQIIGEQEADPNQFGLPWFRYQARIVTSGREGYLPFGPNATITVIEGDHP